MLLVIMMLSMLFITADAFVQPFRGLNSKSLVRTALKAQTFDEFLLGMEIPVLVDFYAQW